MILLMTLLLTKHLVFDFLFQPKYMWANKGTFGHPGGIAHSGLQAIATIIILSIYALPEIAFGIGIMEFFAHYFIDWAKMNINAFFGWGANTSEKFWWLLGFDQWLHQMCYVAIVYYIGVQ